MLSIILTGIVTIVNNVFIYFDFENHAGRSRAVVLEGHAPKKLS